MDTFYQVVLAEDHERFRTEVKKIVNGIPGVEVTGEVGEGQELFELLEKAQPDLLLLDISMPNFKAMKATPVIKSRYPKLKIIIMVVDQEAEYSSHAVTVGADGILLKQDSAINLELAIQKIRQGKSYFPRSSEVKSSTDATIITSIFDRLTVLSIC